MLEKAAEMANHASTRTTQLYDRRAEEVTLDEPRAAQISAVQIDRGVLVPFVNRGRLASTVQAVCRSSGAPVWRGPSSSLAGKEPRMNEVSTSISLAGGHFEGAFLENSYLGAELEGAFLTSANLTGANLSGAKLENTDLGEANLTGVVGLDQEQLNKAKGNSNTVLPKGYIRPSHWS